MASLVDLLRDDPEPEPEPEPQRLDQQIVDALMNAASSAGSLVGSALERSKGPMQDVLPYLGSSIGAIAGSPLGPGGTVGGGALGYDLGERGVRLGQGLADWLVPRDPSLPTAVDRLTGATPIGGPTPTPPPSAPSLSDQVRSELMHSGANLAKGAAMEMGGQAVGAGIGGAAQWVNKHRPNVQEGARDVLATLRGVKSRLTPAQYTDSRTIDLVEGVVEGSFVGGGQIQAIKDGQADAVRVLVKRALTDVNTGLGTRGVSALLTDAVKHKRVWAKTIQRAAYKPIDEAADVPVDTSEVVTFIEKSLAKGETHVKRALDAALPNWRDMLLRQESQAVLFRPVATPARGLREVEQRMGVPGAHETTFAEAANARSSLLALSRKKALDPEVEVVTKTAGFLANKIDDALEASATKLAPDLLKQFRDANAMTKRFEQMFNNETVRAAVETLSETPAKLASTLLKPNNVDVLEAVQKAVPGAWPTVQNKLAEQLVLRAIDPTKGQLKGAALERYLYGLGTETGDAAFGKETYEALQRLARTARFVQTAKSKAEGAGSVAIKLTQAGAMLNIVLAPITGFTSGQAAAGAAATVLGPYMVGKVLASPRAIHFIADGLQPGIGVEQVGRLASQLAMYSATGSAPSTPPGGLAPSRPPLSILDQIQ